MSLYDIALEIAINAHKNQFDKAGVDYIQHPLYVANLVSTDEEKCAALLHDVVEDSEYTLDDLTVKGIPQAVVTAVLILTKQQGVPYDDYLKKVKQNKIARAVKLADLQHNSDLSRLSNINEKDIKRQEKYKKAIGYLQ